MTAPIGPGAMLAGKYRVERVLGEGGMGIVVAARHTQLDQRVAVKFMRAEALGQGDGVDRFLREARAAARLTGDHVVRVMDVGTLDDGAPYIVMEYLEGRDLSSVLAERGKLPVAEAGAYVLEACEAMSEAHAEGIVHRDLKPENLFLVRRPGRKPLIKVLDFGISKLLELTDALSSTRTSVMMGSPAYMSPEQMQSPKYVDGRTDVWSLGVILYQLVAGKLPYHAESVLMLSALVLTTEPPPLASVAPEVPPAFAAVVHRCLTRDLAKRFQSVDELADALAASVVGLETPVPARLTAPEASWTGAGSGAGKVPRLGTPPPIQTGAGSDATVPATAGMTTPIPASQPVTMPATPAALATTKRRGGMIVAAMAGAAVIAGIVVFAVIKSGAVEEAPDKVPAPVVAPAPAPTPAPAPAVAPDPPTPTPTPPPTPPPTPTPPTDVATPAVPATTVDDKPEAPIKKKRTKRGKRPKERHEDDPFGTLQ